MDADYVPFREDERELLRFVTAGSVDDGKSTLIGRLLYDSKSIFQDQLESIERISKLKGNDYIDLSLIVDGLKAEREQGITIDVAYRYFATPSRKFIIADTPGHIEYTRNMVTGASNADLIIILIDARNGIVEQTKRHSFIASLLQIPHVFVCINKMDMVNYDQSVYEKIKEEYKTFASKLDVKDIQFIPISALHGDNVVDKSKNMEWYAGSPLLYLLENVYVGSDYNMRDCRFPIQYAIRPQNMNLHDYRGYAGRVAGGIFRKGDKVVALPSGFESEIEAIEFYNQKVNDAFPPMSVVIRLKDDIDLSRGDMLARPNNLPTVGQDIDLMICWLNKNKLVPGGKYIVRQGSREAIAVIKEVFYKVNVNTLHRVENDKEINMNDVARIKIKTSQPLIYDSYNKNRMTGSLILIDEITNETVAAGMIR